MNDKYIIKITRRTPELWGYRKNEEEIHYYNKESVVGNKRAYNIRKSSTDVNNFTKQEVKKNVKEIKRIYKESTDNGTLLKIEILNSDGKGLYQCFS